LGSQTDSKVLLGTYVCTSTPGSFKWKAGILTTAVQEGRWVLIEDIDMAPMDVMSILIPLLESRHLFIPSRGEKIKAKNGFQIFATRTTGNAEGTRWSHSAGSSLWNCVHVEPLTTTELETVLKTKFQLLSHLVPMLIQLFDKVVQMTSLPGMHHRPLSRRDLFQFCFRVDQVLRGTTYEEDIHSGMNPSMVLDESMVHHILSEANDCFCAMMPRSENRLTLLRGIGDVLGIPCQRVDYFVEHHDPPVELDTDRNRLSVGRVQLTTLNQKLGKASQVSTTFAHTLVTKRVLESVAVSVDLNEPVLLVGETGVGKTTAVQYLASLMSQTLSVVNLSQQTDSSDLLGGFKPVDIRTYARPLKESFDDLFQRTFSAKRNAKFMEAAQRVFSAQKWDKLSVVYQQAYEMAVKKLEKKHDSQPEQQQQVKRKSSDALLDEWRAFVASVRNFEVAMTGQNSGQGKFLFSFVEGALVTAVRRGHWILLDEINLASTETLECLSSLLQSASGSILLTERGDSVPIKRHPNFRLFACMNPATDVGKKDLPRGLRSRFTELYVDSPDSSVKDLTLIVNQYIKQVVSEPHERGKLTQDIVEFYVKAKEASLSSLADGANQRPHFSMRTLTRALNYACSISGVYGVRRSFYEGLCMSFGTQLSRASSEFVVNLAMSFLFKGVKKPQSVIKSVPPCPATSGNHPGFVQFDCFWLEKGLTGEPVDPIELDNSYIMTPSVQTNLRNLARVVVARKYPVLLQGPTSSGKTSMVEFLAKKTGHRFVRINNHEHTDIQEYVGSYVTNAHGELVFQEGMLVQALRHGYWIVLDELNLAPSDVLEALNRLLDDNRELLIPETQEIVTPHPDFMLFATQNPAGAQYGGRKPLSRAFRNRFLELHFEDIPTKELSLILERRCRIPPSYAALLLKVYDYLTQRRQGSRLFDGKHGFITLRDLFRWAKRYADDRELFAYDGFMLLAERIRKEEDKRVVKECIESVMKVVIQEDQMYDYVCDRLEEYHEYKRLLEQQAHASVLRDVVWTKAMKRLFALVTRSIQHSEAVLLVGETGCGKTTICQMLSIIKQQKLHILNCQQNTETADFLGGQRPVRNKAELVRSVIEEVKQVCAELQLFIQVDEDMELEDIISGLQGLTQSMEKESHSLHVVNELLRKAKRARALFEWYDGPLVQAIKQGDLFLLDEISLADDSVLERLNSLLESQRLLVLAEKAATAEDQQVDHLIAHESFQFMATMNPGGDYGKKELSPALRNRFTEIWVSAISDTDDVKQIIETHLAPDLRNQGLSDMIVQYVQWYHRTLDPTRRAQSSAEQYSLRDILSWVTFMNRTCTNLGSYAAFVHGGSMVLVDRLGMTVATPEYIKETCMNELRRLATGLTGSQEVSLQGDLQISPESFALGPFSVARGSQEVKSLHFTLNAPTTNMNALRVLRAMQLARPILLEGSPGVGKTSLVTALAQAVGIPLVRINLSEQTDLMDLFGTDLPVENGKPGEFCWKDGPFLQAMQSGHWVLLDEINLASQSVLEGLNACLDHRGEAYVPELDMTFRSADGFRIFAAQNPVKEGGGRKGLPRSFLNRFSQVFVDALSREDVLFISKSMYPLMEEDALVKMIEFNARMHYETMVKRSFGREGAPWEFNLRDVFRWIELVMSGDAKQGPDAYVEMVYVQRMRNEIDRQRVRELYAEMCGGDLIIPQNPSYDITPTHVRVGSAFVPRQSSESNNESNSLQLFQHDLPVMESVLKCVELGWMAILGGPSGSGKTSLVRLLAQITGHRLEEFAMNSGVDTMELLGGFEQVDVMRHEQLILDKLKSCVSKVMKHVLLRGELGSQKTTGDLKLVSQAWSALMMRAAGKVQDQSRAILVVQAMRQVLEVCQSMLSLYFPEADMNSMQELTTLITDFAHICSEPVSGRFEWINGVLIKALIHGHWVLIDNANFCSPSVLDRLNPLLESKGKLMVNERGLVHGEIQVIEPHPNFRLFLTLDPANGDLSRAMRNRGIEINLLPSTSLTQHPRDSLTLMNSLGLPGGAVPRLLSQYHEQMVLVVKSVSALVKDLGARELAAFGSMVLYRLALGMALGDAIRMSVKDVYCTKHNVSVDDVMDKLDLGALSAVKEPGASCEALSCPYPVTLDLHTTHSTLARVLLDCGYFLHLVTSCSTAQSHIEGAADWIVLSSSVNDWRLRVSLLQHVMSSCTDIGMLRTEQVCEVIKCVFESDPVREVENVSGGAREMCQV
jgi:midasin (ATPase involved in ribosome maturation)